MSTIYLLKYDNEQLKTFMSTLQATEATGCATSGTRIIDSAQPAVAFHTKAEAKWFWNHHSFYIKGRSKCVVYEADSAKVAYRFLEEVL